MTTAFVLWGGGSLGAVQVGMLRALTDADIRPHVAVGNSVGALNGVHYPADPTPDGVDDLATLWRDLGGHDLFPVEVAQPLEALLHDLPFAPSRGIRRALGMANYAFPVDPMTLCAAWTGSARWPPEIARAPGSPGAGGARPRRGSRWRTVRFAGCVPTCG
ncbi:patatin-like phospholipase family protein [Gandjariella thermophila]|uniref:PNPLA domain-containing protein n=1 Tax=Gandjariella thermophila TaxID=1931992 RepID=A0A4D4J315_9PSEU|nr:patatin-like phospholipase family protein [Gandjariella thermophila]GDY28393.1 hypothetical protein GTS_00260 [Gandjariella thermophila]